MPTLHHYRDKLIAVINPATDDIAYYSYAKQLVEVCCNSGHVFILGYLPIGIDTLSLKDLQELFPGTEVTLVLPDELITEFMPKPVLNKKKRG